MIGINFTREQAYDLMDELHDTINRYNELNNECGYDEEPIINPEHIASLDAIWQVMRDAVNAAEKTA